MKTLIKSGILLAFLLVSFRVELCYAEMPVTQENGTENEVERRPLSMNFSYINTNDTSRIVRVELKTYTFEQSEKTQNPKKSGKRWAPASNVIVNLYLNEISKAGGQGSIATDSKGIAEFNLVNKFNAAKDTSKIFNFKVRVLGDMIFEDLEEEMVILDGKIEVEAFIEYSTKFIKASVARMDENGDYIPYKDAEVQFYVKRDYGLLPLSESTFSTDENGEIVLELPFEMPGDEDGNLTLITRLENNEEFGLIIIETKKQWGIPTLVVRNTEDRALWSSYANVPIWLLITINLMLLGIWLTILYIVNQLFKIKKIGKQNTLNI